MQPLGFLAGLDSPYVSAGSIETLYQRWQKLTSDREEWVSQIDKEIPALEDQ
jgi:hypothetical protein